MLIYNTQELDNRLMGMDADEAAAEGMISPETAGKIKTAHPFTLYSPNNFVRIGLALVSICCVVLGAGLIALLMLDGIGNNWEGFLLFWGLLTYGVLEGWMAGHKHFRSGVDEGLLWSSACFLAFGIIALYENYDTTHWVYFVLTIIATWFSIRLAEPVMTLTAWICGILFVLFASIMYLPGAQFILPFLIMAISAAAYFATTRMQPQWRFRHYDISLSVLRLAALLTFYMAGNYYVVHSLGNELLGMEGEPPLPWLFWALTLCLPPLYIWMGLRRKDRIPLAAGLLLIAAAVFTVRAYHSVMPIETAMILGGIVLVAISYAAHRYLKTPQKGFTTQAMHTKHFGIEQLEGLIIAETMQQTAQPQEPTIFKGGSGGGGGASGEF